MARRIPYLVGNRYPTDFFAAETRFPYDAGLAFAHGFTRDELMKIMWRVKKWHVTGSFGASDGLGHSFSVTVDLRLTMVDVSNVPVLDELGPIYRALPEQESGGGFPGWMFLGNLVACYQDDSTGTANNLTDTSYVIDNPSALSFGSLSLMWDPITNLFYWRRPPLGLSIVLRGATTHGVAAEIFTAYPLPGAPEPVTITLTPTIIPPITLVTEVAQGGWPPGSVSGSIDILAEEFWPYANSNGDPVYDTTDGHQLTNPFG